MIVFAGPSVPPGLRPDFPKVDWRPPACAGDLLTLVADAPAKVVLLDGLFDERASVMHKEALALMTQGTRLYGAASMGALRAVELARFGMIGVGTIVAAYRHGLLTGDDEVALVHGNERIGWKAASVPMVEVRATICSAVREGWLDKALARRLIARWHAIHYVDREWPVMAQAAANLLEPALQDRLAAGHVLLKQCDAVRAIRFALTDQRQGLSPPKVAETQYFRHMRERLSGSALS